MNCAVRACTFSAVLGPLPAFRCTAHREVPPQPGEPRAGGFWYRQELRVCNPLVNSAGRQVGVTHNCPTCKAHTVIDFTVHDVNISDAGLLTVRPSLLCACGWHVWITEGIAYDA